MHANDDTHIVNYNYNHHQNQSETVAVNDSYLPHSRNHEAVLKHWIDSVGNPMKTFFDPLEKYKLQKTQRKSTNFAAMQFT